MVAKFVSRKRDGNERARSPMGESGEGRRRTGEVES